MCFGPFIYEHNLRKKASPNQSISSTSAYYSEYLAAFYVMKEAYQHNYRLRAIEWIDI